MIHLYETTKEKIASIPYEQEALYFCSDTGDIYFDSIINGERILANSSVTVIQNEASKPLAPVPGMLYAILNSARIWIYTIAGWVCLSGVTIVKPNVAVTSGEATISDPRIVSTDTAVFTPDPVYADLVSSINATCTNGSCSITLTSNYNITGTLVING